MPNNTPGLRCEAGMDAGLVQGIPEKETPFEVTKAGFPHSLVWKGSRMTHAIWCKREVERIAKIPGRLPRIAQHKNRKGELTGMILVVDDEFTLDEHSSHSDTTVIHRFHDTRKQWKN